MNTLPPNMPLDARALLTFADETQNEEARKDKEILSKSEAAAFNGQIDAAKKSVEQSRKASDERLDAAKKKTAGGIIGAIIGIVLLIVCIAAAIFTGGAAAVALIGLGAALLASGSTLGGLVGNKTAEGNEERANKAQEESDALKVDEKELEKSVEEYSDRLEKAEDFMKQIRDSQRNRNDEYRQSKVKG